MNDRIIPKKTINIEIIPTKVATASSKVISENITNIGINPIIIIVTKILLSK